MCSAVPVQCWCGVNITDNMTLTTILHTSIIIITVFSLISGQEPESDSPVLASINQCCSLGAERAQSDQLGCEDIPVPVRDVIAELQAGQAQITLLLGSENHKLDF